MSHGKRVSASGGLETGDTGGKGQHGFLPQGGFGNEERKGEKGF
jgi:hypothetical protein